MLEKTTRVNLLCDFYAPLLTEKQRSMLELYFHEDWSLGEIAAEYEVSRQAVFEAIKRAQGVLEETESHLMLLDKHQKRRRITGEIAEAVSSDPELKLKITPLLEELLQLD
ncbi:putative DNA-binding protein [Mechercharimyces sp. CAU 1602]|uniref:putative DNA-binding protein n=1 Tax=Mechercharimyces sp. CAU 1602 TaxID=2973933 RepID=UPI0021611F3D|nr:putative DNA-binding protein [Mechercharimyces sp. CAU 1602]MCS1351358.1 putative DNA-binding protein [Mechercharimyces sp. CAU 1602]